MYLHSTGSCLLTAAALLQSFYRRLASPSEPEMPSVLHWPQPWASNDLLVAAGFFDAPFQDSAIQRVAFDF